jgi:hypothetical protein
MHVMNVSAPKPVVGADCDMCGGGGGGGFLCSHQRMPLFICAAIADYVRTAQGCNFNSPVAEGLPDRQIL